MKKFIKIPRFFPGLPGANGPPSTLQPETCRRPSTRNSRIAVIQAQGPSTRRHKSFVKPYVEAHLWSARARQCFG